MKALFINDDVFTKEAICSDINLKKFRQIPDLEMNFVIDINEQKFETDYLFPKRYGRH